MLASLNYVFTGISIRTCTLMYEICSCHYGYFNIEGVTMLCCNKFVGIFKGLWKIWGFFWRGFLRNFFRPFQIFGDFGFSPTFLGCNSKHSNIRIFESLLFELSSRVESSRIESNIRLFRIFAHPYFHVLVFEDTMERFDLHVGVDACS